MLYGLEDYAYDEFGLEKKNKFNIKIILLIILVVLVCAIFGYLIFSRAEKDDNNIATEENNNYILSTTENAEREVKDIEKTKKKSNINLFGKSENEIDVYEGNHYQIPNHNFERINSKLRLPQFNESGYDEVKNIYFSEEKQVYLTFDDGPSKDVTPQILDILKEHDVKATFFVLGARVDLYPETLKRAFEEGHYIANHGYSHQYSKIYENKDTVFQEYVECDIAIRNAIGEPDFNSYLFRFPGGSSGGRYEKVKAQAREHFKSYGIAFTNWNCLTGDAEGKETKEECVEEFMNTKSGRNSLVVLMHDSNEKTQTVEALPDIIMQLKNEGYTFKTFYDIF